MDNHRLIAALRNLTTIGNTVIVVEHDKDIMLASDYILDMGPKAGAWWRSGSARNAKSVYKIKHHYI